MELNTIQENQYGFKHIGRFFQRNFLLWSIKETRRHKENCRKSLSQNKVIQGYGAEPRLGISISSDKIINSIHGKILEDRIDWFPTTILLVFYQPGT